MRSMCVLLSIVVSLLASLALASPVAAQNQPPQCASTSSLASDPLAYFEQNPTVPIGILAAAIAYLSYLSTRKHWRYRNTIDKFAIYRTDDDRRRFGLLNAVLENPAEYPMIDLASFKSPSPQHSQAVKDTLNEWEEIALGAKYGIYDEVVLYEYYGSIALVHWTAMLPFIRARQQVNPKSWREFDTMALRWLVRRDASRRTAELQQLRTLTAQIDSILTKLSE